MWLAVGALAVGAAVAASRSGSSPDAWLERAMHAAAGAGFAGMALFGVVYVIAALAFVPGSAITLAAGALYGPWRGTVLVSLASTLTAALAFLIARHLARERVARLAQRHRAFGAVDRAVSEGGWRVVGLLRLSPAIPFSAGNYLFGLTGVAFWPYVLASWVGMLPGTLLYVSLGHAGRTAVAGTARGPGEWTLLAVGLAATAAVTVSLARRARRILGSRADLPNGGDGAAS